MNDTLPFTVEPSMMSISNPVFKNKKIARELKEATLAPDELPIMEIVNTIEGEGALIGTPRVFVRIAGCAVGCRWCFPSTNQIMTTIGLTRLSQVKEGDTLYTLDENMNVVTTKVTKVLQHKVPVDALVKVAYREKRRKMLLVDSIICTQDHPFHVKDKGYVAAKDLQANNVIYHVSNYLDRFDGGYSASPSSPPVISKGAKVVSVEPLSAEDRANIQRVYDDRTSETDPVSVTNFECAPYNHYLIQGLHVHNCDTKHSWSAKGYPVLKIQDIVDKVLSLIALPDGTFRAHEVSITGGEPLHYPLQLAQLCHALHRVSLKVNLETSGVILVPQLFTHFDYVSMDIKTPSSGVKLLPEAIAEITHLGKTHTNIYLKVVIASKVDFLWLEDNFFTLLLHSKNPIVITPCADTTKKPVNVNAITDTISMLMDLNKDYNIRVIAQQHKLLSYY